MDAEKAKFPIAWMCRRFGVSRAGFYAWRRREPSKHHQRDEVLKVKIADVHEANRGVYGRPRITKELRSVGEKVSEKRVGRLMREEGISGRRPKRFRRTTDSKHNLPVSENLVQRRFDADSPNQVWVGDITYIGTWEGWLYLAVVIDLFSRRVVGWAIADHMRTELVSEAFAMAVMERQPGPGLIYHSDRGVQYASQAYQTLLDAEGAVPSMSRKGDCWDNAVAESFFGTLKEELIYRDVWPTRARARAAVTEYITCFFNSRRRHSTIGDVSPMEYELARQRQLAA